MAPIKFSEAIRPISDLKTKAFEIIREVSENQSPVVLTRHGRGVAVIISVEEYESLQERARSTRIFEALNEAEEDIESNRVISHSELKAKWSVDE